MEDPSERAKESSGRRSRSRSRSRSPDRGREYGDGGQAPASRDFKNRKAERERRMARLRAENEAEEQKLSAAVESAASGGSGGGASASTGTIEVKEGDLDGMDDAEQMRLLLGFSGDFGSTKGKAVEDNQKSAAKGAANKNKARKYRQYMNRKGGFNRPLDKMS